MITDSGGVSANPWLPEDRKLCVLMRGCPIASFDSRDGFFRICPWQRPSCCGSSSNIGRSLPIETEVRVDSASSHAEFFIYRLDDCMFMFLCRRHRATYSKGNIEGIIKKVNQFAGSLADTDFALGPDATSQLKVMAESLAGFEAERSVT